MPQRVRSIVNSGSAVACLARANAVRFGMVSPLFPVGTTFTTLVDDGVGLKAARTGVANAPSPLPEPRMGGRGTTFSLTSDGFPIKTTGDGCEASSASVDGVFNPLRDHNNALGQKVSEKAQSAHGPLTEMRWKTIY
jgi:hypothetical protein